MDNAIPLAYLYDLFKANIRDFVDTSNILGMLACFVSWSIGAPLIDGAEQYAFLADKKHVLIGRVYTKPVSGDIKRAILTLPLDDLARQAIVHAQNIRPYPDGERVLYAATWLIPCAAHPSAATNNGLAVMFSRLFAPNSPKASQSAPNNCEKQLRDAASGRRGPFPGLTQALCETYGDQSPTCTDNICHILRVFVQMAMDTTETFMIYQDVNISARGGNPRFDGAMFEDALFYSLEFTVVANPTVLPASVRRILAHSNYKGNITFLLYKQKKFPREAVGTTLHFLMYKWIIEAALHPNTGISHVVRPLTEKHFEMPWLDPNFTSEDMEKFRPRGMNYYTVRELESRIRRTTVSFSIDVPLQAIGPHNDP
jgi:hypothetical protein